jgi:hypothetical protein
MIRALAENDSRVRSVLARFDAVTGHNARIELTYRANTSAIHHSGGMS